MPISPPAHLTSQDPHVLDASSRLMFEAAQKQGITCTILPDNQTILMRHGELEWYSRGSRTSTQSAIGQTIAGNKATAKQFLHAYDIPTAQSVFVEKNDDLTQLTALHWPVVM